MYTQDIINKFIELRAQNISIRKIADQIGVHRNTLMQWEHKHAEEVQNLRVLELEAIQERLLPSYEQQLTELADEYRRVVTELKTRDMDYEPTAYLANRQVTLLSQMRKMRALPSINPPKESTDPAQTS